MRCKTHTYDSSSTVGVCATCLRERLLSLIAAQSHPSRNQVHAQLLAAAASSLDHRRKSDHHHPPPHPILFPRSVSPYVTRGKKLHDYDDPLPDRRFYSTPQTGHPPNCQKHRGRFSFIPSFFRPRSDKSDFELKLPRDPRETSYSATTTSSSSSFWFSSIRRKHKSKPTNVERLPRRGVVLDRGMTPERTSCADGSEFDEPRFEYISDSCKRTPARSAKPGSSMSGMAFCMSPLVRASPARLWSVSTDIVGFPGEIRSVGNSRHSAASSYCANRSRKLADLGRVSCHHH